MGLFAAALAQAVGETGQVVAVESDPSAVASAAGNLAAYPSVRRACGPASTTRSGCRGPAGRVPRASAAAALTQAASGTRCCRRRADLVVLDPPRTGAGQAVIGAVVALRPRAIAYVACDPAALARDTAFLVERGYPLDGLRAFDAFPMTHHVECIALFTRPPRREPARAVSSTRCSTTRCGVGGMDRHDPCRLDILTSR